MPATATNQDTTTDAHTRVHAVEWETKQAKNGQRYRVGVAPSLNNLPLLVLRDLAGVLDYPEHRLNTLVVEKQLCATYMTTGASTGYRQRAIALVDYNKVRDAVEKAKAWRAPVAVLGKPEAKQKWTVWPFEGGTVSGLQLPTVDVIVVPVGGVEYCRLREIARIAGLPYRTALHRLNKRLAASDGTPWAPLVAEQRRLQFTPTGTGAGRPTMCWPVSQVPLLLAALLDK